MAAPSGVEYGTFVPEKDAGYKEEECASRDYQWEGIASPWTLFIQAVILIGKNLATLLLLYWTLLRGPAAKKNLMVCNPVDLAPWQLVGCEYTKAWLRAFPLLAIVITLDVALRTLVQQRVYYGFLKVGGLLDFKNVKGYKDPLLILLVISVLHSCAHFGLKLSDQRGDVMLEARQVVTNFLLPYVVFLAFLFGSYDVEQMLVPLSKYFEEDPEYASQTLGKICFMPEAVVRTETINRDVVAAALCPGQESTSIEAVYRDIIRSYPEAKARMLSPRDAAFQFHFKFSHWPSRLLIDGRLNDSSSKSFRQMFNLLLAMCLFMQIGMLYLLMDQACKDLYQDAYLQGDKPDAISGAVLLVHAAFVLWMMDVTLWPVVSSVAKDHIKSIDDHVQQLRNSGVTAEPTG